MDDKGLTMYTVLFPSGRTLTLGNKAIADIYIVAYRGILISDQSADYSPIISESIIWLLLTIISDYLIDYVNRVILYY